MEIYILSLYKTTFIGRSPSLALNSYLILKFYNRRDIFIIIYSCAQCVDVWFVVNKWFRSESNI